MPSDKKTIDKITKKVGIALDDAQKSRAERVERARKGVKRTNGSKAPRPGKNGTGKSSQEALAKQRRAIFIAELKLTANVAASTRAAGVTRARAYQWRDEHSDFVKLWDAAIDEAVDGLEAEAWRRGVDGIDAPVTHKGIITDTYKSYSDQMLGLLLRGHRPSKYKDRHEITGEGGGPVITRIERVIVDNTED